jgi:hypothetical protein
LPPAAPLTFAAAAGLGAESLTTAQLESITLAAIARLEAAGEDVSGLSDVTLRISDLNGQGALGLAGSRLILIDDDALGHGWFIDPTPLLDEEFSFISATELAASSSAALGRVDLLTVVMHELGHILGHGDLDSAHSNGDLMTGSLGLGIRRLPAADHAAESVGSGWQAQELSIPAISSLETKTAPSTSSARPLASGFTNLGQRDSQTLKRELKAEELFFTQGATKRSALSQSTEDEEALTTVGADRDDAAIVSSREERDALQHLFAELSHSDLASKSLWEQMED